MKKFFEQLVAFVWNRFRGRERGAWHEERGNLDLGLRVVDGQVTKRHVSLSNTRRAMHIAVLGKTGTGKSSLLRYLTLQDIEADRGFVYFDLHGDATPFLLAAINARERRLRRHLSDKVVLIEPADPFVSVGLNPLEQASSPDFVRISEFAQVLKQRWALDHFGARTDELLRNSLYALSANGLTLIELSPFLTNSRFRAACLKRISNAEVRQYFEQRYDQTSESMRALMREPILNKVTAFTGGLLRHVIGQAKSTFSIREAMDEGQWVIVNLAKGSLGEQAITLGSLIFTVLKNALFTREKRSLYTLYCDEIQNLIAYGSGIDTVLSEARKFGVGIVSANQFLDQYPAEIRAAILSIGTHVFFQLSSTDATQIAQALDGGKVLAEHLKNLYQRRCVVKSGADRWTEVRVADVRTPDYDYTDLLNRARYKRAMVRQHIEREIAKRQALLSRSAEEALNDFE